MDTITKQVRSALADVEFFVDEVAKYKDRTTEDTIIPWVTNLRLAIERLADVVDQIDDRVIKLENPR